MGPFSAQAVVALAVDPKAASVSLETGEVGLDTFRPDEDDALWQDLLTRMADTSADMTLLFRSLAELPLGPDAHEERLAVVERGHLGHRGRPLLEGDDAALHVGRVDGRDLRGVVGPREGHGEAVVVHRVLPRVFPGPRSDEPDQSG